MVTEGESKPEATPVNNNNDMMDDHKLFSTSNAFQIKRVNQGRLSDEKNAFMHPD